MKNLRNSIIVLFLFYSIVLSIAQVQYIEDNVLNFQAVFFVMLVLATLVGIWGPQYIRSSMYSYMGAWTLVYVFVWAVYWRFLELPRTPEELTVQYLLVVIAAALSHNVGKQINHVNVVLDDIAGGAYPNRTLDFKMASDAVNRELTRSRRYSRPLSLLVFELANTDEIDEKLHGIERDLSSHFLAAKTGRIINEHARQTDLIMRDDEYRFVVLCPETDQPSGDILGKRIHDAIDAGIGMRSLWSASSFPNDALSFDELYDKALSRLPASVSTVFVHDAVDVVKN